MLSVDGMVRSARFRIGELGEEVLPGLAMIEGFRVLNMILGMGSHVGPFFYPRIARALASTCIRADMRCLQSKDLCWIDAHYLTKGQSTCYYI